MPIVPLEYIEVDDRGVAKLVGTRVKVMHLVATQRQEGYSAEQLTAEFPDLPPEMVYAALAYYHAHRAEVDRQVEESVRYAEEMRAKYPNRFTRAELLARLPPGDRERLARESERLDADESSGS